jgi:hypothetical protein
VNQRPTAENPSGGKDGDLNGKKEVRQFSAAALRVIVRWAKD